MFLKVNILRILLYKFYKNSPKISLRESVKDLNLIRCFFLDFLDFKFFGGFKISLGFLGFILGSQDCFYFIFVGIFEYCF